MGSPSGNGHIIAPFFFDENVNGESYLNMLNEEVIPEMNILYDFDAWGDVRFQQNVWWFQDGAPYHRRRIVIDCLRELFGGQVVAFNHENEWPAISPDLTPCDFFLWGYIKCKVYLTPPPKIFVLRERIMHEFDQLKNNR